MIFTRHAIERYRQFHMLDQPTATDDDARQILERFGPTAIRVGAKTHRGDPVWCIESLGVELVAKHESGVVTCVTVLPPVRFRGLTPLQAEAVEEAARGARERAADAERELAEAKAALAESKRPAKAQEATRIGQARSAVTSTVAERDILLSTLKTMRQQMASDRDTRTLKAALRIAVRHLLAIGATDALAEIAAIEPGLASEAFANGGNK